MTDKTISRDIGVPTTNASNPSRLDGWRLLAWGALTLAAFGLALAAVADALNTQRVALGVFALAGLAGTTHLLGPTAPRALRTAPGAFWTALLLTPGLPLLIAGVVYSFGGGRGEAIAGAIVFILAFAAPSYFIVGGPFLWRETRRPAAARSFTLSAFIANAAACGFAVALALLVTLAADELYALGSAVIFPVILHLVGAVVAPLMGMLFAGVYLRLRPPPPPARASPAGAPTHASASSAPASWRSAPLSPPKQRS